MADTPYVANPRDLRDVNENLKLLIQKVNHEQSAMNKDIQNTNKKVATISVDVNILKTDFLKFYENIKGMSLMLKILMGVISTAAGLIGIGALVSAFN